VKTRDRILAQSLELFNAEGAPGVTTNAIAAELGMSPGNLYYHFKNKQQIIEQLLRRFDDVLAPFGSAPESVHELDDLWLALHLLFENIDAYRFVYRDSDYLMREFAPLARRLHRMTLVQVATLRRVYLGLAQRGVLRATDQVSDVALRFRLNGEFACGIRHRVTAESWSTRIPAKKSVSSARARSGSTCATY